MLLCVRWYLRYPLSYRNLEDMMLERGLTVDHTTVYRWVQAYAPELDKRCRPHLKPTNDSWRVDETYIEVKGEWKYRLCCKNFLRTEQSLQSARVIQQLRKFETRTLLDLKCLVFLLLEFVPCESCSLLRTPSKFASPC